MEAEAKFALLIWALTALVVVAIPVILILTWWIKYLIRSNEEDREFTKLMIALYEQEKQKKERQDESYTENSG